jgi:serine/threonine protein kinase
MGQKVDTLNVYYEEGRLIGEGTFGRVISAKCNKTNERVAIRMIDRTNEKLPRPENQVDEIRRLCHLHHSNVISYMEHYEYLAGERRRGIGVVMELCNSSYPSLQVYLVSCRRPLDKSLRYTWYLQMVTGLQFLHSHDIIHRNLKPSNIMIDNTNCIKIGDAGIAKTAWDSQLVVPSRLGQPFSRFMIEQVNVKLFIAPEVHQADFTKECDVFSLGLIFWIMAATPNTNLTPSCNGVSLAEHLNSNPNLRAALASEIGLSPILQTTVPPEEIAMLDSILKYDPTSRANIDSIITQIAGITAQKVLGRAPFNL